MAINLATKYSDKIASVFTQSSFVAGNTSKEWDFSGVNSVKIYTPLTVDLNDYNKTATSNRYGTPVEMQDTVQEMPLTQDKSFAITIDKGNNTEQQLTKNGGKMLKLQIDEKNTPAADKYALSTFIQKAGTVKTIASAPTKTTIVDFINDCVIELDEGNVPQDNRIIYITASTYKLLRTSTEFIALESLGTKAITKGVVGEMFDCKVVKVPTSYLPTGAYCLVTHKSAVLMPWKINDAKIHQDPPGISGALLEGRDRYDAFVVGARCKGVCAGVLAASKQAAVTEAHTTPGTYVLTSANATGIKYTIDGTDPRYSTTAVTIATGAGVEITAACKLKAYAYRTGYFPSDVAEFDAVPAE